MSFDVIHTARFRVAWRSEHFITALVPKGENKKPISMWSHPHKTNSGAENMTKGRSEVTDWECPPAASVWVTLDKREKGPKAVTKEWRLLFWFVPRARPQRNSD